MTTIQPNYNYATQPVQAVAPTTGTPNNTVNPYQQYQQPVNYTQQQPVNTSNPAQLQQLQQQYVIQIPQTTPQQQTTTAPTSNDTSPEGINEMVKQFSREADYWVADANARKAQEDQLKQQQQQVQTPTAQVAQTQVQPTTVQPATGTTTQTPVASNPQVATTTQPQQTKPPTVGSSDGQGNILMSDPQTGQSKWVPEQEVLAMYQNGSNENRGKVQLPDGSWVDKSTVERVTEKLNARLQLKTLLEQGKITPEEFKLAGGEQDLSPILGPSVASRNQKARERMKAAVGDVASEKSLNPYSGFTPSAGGGEAS
ncbi:MAG: hypothetical protein ACK5T0_10285 [Vampirovibrionales bacterium]